MRCCGLVPQPRRRRSPPPLRPSFLPRLSHCFNKSSSPKLSSSPPPPPRRSFFHLHLPHCLNDSHLSCSPPPRRISFHLRLPYCLKKSSLPSCPSLSPPPPPPPPPRPCLQFFPNPLPLPRLQNSDGVDRPSLLITSPPPSPPTRKLEELPPAETAPAPIREAEQKSGASGFPLGDAKFIAAFGDLSSEAKVGNARKGRLALVLDRAMVNGATRAAFLGATTGAVLVGKVALMGAATSVAMVCSSLQMIRRVWDSSSGKVTPLPPPHQLPDVAIFESVTPQSDSIETLQRISRFSETPSNRAANSMSSPHCLKRVDSKQEDRHLAPCISAHELDLVGAVGDRSPSLNSTPRAFLNQASLNKKNLRKSERSLRNQTAERSNVNLSRAEQQKSSSVGFFLATIGLLIGLSGLFGGRFLAVLVVVCWLYAIPSLTRTAEEKQSVVIINIGEGGTVDQKEKKRDSSSALSTLERRPSDYRKRVIMEGILERDRRPTTV